MAGFPARSIYGSDAGVPVSGTVMGQPYDCTTGPAVFIDVPPGHPFCRHIHAIASLGITLGCSTNQYCPDQFTRRDQMAAFLARALLGSDDAVPGSGVARGQPYDCVNGHALFTDVPPGHPFCRHIHYIYGQGVSDGCGSNQYCPNQNVTRGQMAKFIVRAFSLVLYPGTAFP